MNKVSVRIYICTKPKIFKTGVILSTFEPEFSFVSETVVESPT